VDRAFDCKRRRKQAVLTLAGKTVPGSQFFKTNEFVDGPIFLQKAVFKQ